MATFSTNQVRQLYVAKELKTPHVLPKDSAGSIAVYATGTPQHLYFEYKGVDGIMRSDIIDTNNILYAKATSASDMRQKLKAFKVTLDSEVNGGAPIAGQDYILRISFRQYIGMSDEDLYQKYGMVHVYSGMTASDFYKKLAISLAKNFSREVVPLVEFILLDSEDNETIVDAVTSEDSLTDTYTSIIINEIEQPWRLGIEAQVPVYFTINPTSVILNGDERIWGTVEKIEDTITIGNGKKIADLEYFCMGERGDIYRGIGYPHNITTTYLVDPSIEYNVIDIHYAYVGSNESVQKSEKTITIVVPAVGTSIKEKNQLTNNIVNKINSSTGMDICSGLPTA